ncbi:autotransporter domain-containing protein [Candidatus Avelusimicrobium fimicolum]|uniref:autotransporter domain-containing protein n=1 Tax=Candidatus Avelusimicrobium fimicolum TaxID=3416216 RepID=UPI0015B25DD8
MRKFLVAVFFVLFAPLFVQAAQNIQINWDGQDHSREIVGDNPNKPLAIVGAGSLNAGAINGASLTVNGANISISDSAIANEIYHSVTPDKFEIPTSSDNTRKGAYVAGGAAYNNNVTNNSVSITDTNLTGRDVMGGVALIRQAGDRFGAASANNNSVSISGGAVNSYTFTPTGATSTVLGGNVYGGYTKFSKGSANNNTVSITNGATVQGDVIGGFTDERLTEEDVKTDNVIDTKANGNYVLVKDATVGGMVAGARGAATAENNTVVIDHSTVDSVVGADEGRGVADSASSVVNMDNNTVIVRNNSTVTNMAAAVTNSSVNAKGNTLTLDNSTVNMASIYAVKMGLATDVDKNPVSATVGSNTLNLNNMSDTFTELGGSVNLAGTANGNVVNVTNSALTLNNSGKFFGDTLDLTNLSANKLLPATMPKDQGAIFGGASMTYTRKVNSTPTEEAPEEEKVSIGGTNSDNNTVSLAGGDSVKDVKANVFGGFSAYINEVNYQTKDDSGVITTVKKEGLVTKTTSSDPAAEAQEPEEADQIDDVYSASNNTVILDNVKFNGKVYGGYVYGAELKEQNMLTQNNTVILRNKVELDPAAVIYGGNNGLYEFSTNQLVFDRTIGTFTNKDQFQNFNDWWTINADFKTDLHFDFGVYANMTLDKSTMKEASKTVVTTVGSVADLKDVREGGILYDLVDSGVVLTQKKVGVYSYDLTPTRGTGNEILWTLTSTKDKANAEVYGQLPLVGLALISEGPEMLTQTLNDLWKSDTEQNTFINGGYHHTRYETGSGFDLDSGLTQAGAWKKFTNDWALGIFAKYAGGSYKTFPIKVTGDANVFGGGLMTSLRYSETGRLEATVEAGYVDAKFESSELLSTFKTKGMYYGASAGFVENPLEDLSLYANFNWKRKASDDITDDLDQKIKFDTLQSMALRFGGDYAFNFVDWKGVIPSIGASAIYEMDGESTVTVEDVKSSEASMKGMSGRGQISLAYHNQDTFLPLHSVLTVYGQVGKREGFGGEVNISFEF